MLIYIINLLLLFLWWGLYNKTKKKIFFIIPCLQLILISGLRGLSVGTDTLGYVRIYQSYITSGVIEYSRIESGYRFFMKAISIFGTDGFVLLITTSAFISILTFISIKENSNDIFLSIFLFVSLYFYYNSFNGIRQYMAISIVIYAYKYIIQKKPVVFTLFILVASLFHTTALVALILTIFAIKSISTRFKVLFITLTGSLIIFLPAILDYIILLFPKYSDYIDSTLVTESGGIMYFVLSLSLLLFGVVILLSNRFNNRFLNEFLVVVIVFLLSFRSMFGFIGLNRLIWFFSIFFIFFIPTSLATIRDPRVKQLVKVTIIILSIAFNIYFLLNNQQRIVPYLGFLS